MKRLIYSTQSLDDLEGILRYIARDAPDTAVRFVGEIERQCEMLQQSPGMGERQDDLAPLLRRFCFRSYAIYYRELEDQVRIERVLHGARNVKTNHFE